MGYIERAEKAVAPAAELEPGNANVRGWQSVLLAHRGAREDAVRAALEQARLGNPIGHIEPAIYLLHQARAVGASWTAGREEMTAPIVFIDFAGPDDGRLRAL